MLPVNDFNEQLEPDFEEVVGPSKNYYLMHNLEHITGFVDDLKAIEQAIFMLLSVERYRHKIYSWNVGVEFEDLFGKPVSYVASEVKRRIREALIQDDRINEVDSFEVAAKKGVVTVKYVARTIYGDIEGEREVMF